MPARSCQPCASIKCLFYPGRSRGRMGTFRCLSPTQTGTSSSCARRPSRTECISFYNCMKSELTQLPHLETFVQAAELGSFTKAARALSLTQAAVSQRIGALEKVLRQALFQRRGG